MITPLGGVFFKSDISIFFVNLRLFQSTRFIKFHENIKESEGIEIIEFYLLFISIAERFPRHHLFLYFYVLKI